MQKYNEMAWLDILRGYYLDVLEDNNYNLNNAFAPLYVGFKITEKCNQVCKHCWAGKSKNNKSYSEIKEAMNKLEFFKPFMVGISGGEPFVHENAMDIIEYCIKKFSCVEVLTNAELLTDDMIEKLSVIMRKNDYLQISIDGLRENYFKQRGNDSFEKVVSNISKLVEKKVTVRIHMTVTDINIGDMLQVYELAEALNVNTFSITYVYPLREGKEIWKMANIDNYYTLAKKIEDKHSKSCTNMHLSIFYPIEIQSKLAHFYPNDNCLVPNFDIFHWTIDGNGDIYNYMDYYIYNSLKIGNIYEDCIEKIKNQNYKLQKKLMYRNLSNTKCENCSILNQCMGGSFIDTYPNINLPDRRCLFSDGNHR